MKTDHESSGMIGLGHVGMQARNPAVPLVRPTGDSLSHVRRTKKKGPVNRPLLEIRLESELNYCRER